MFIHRSTVRRTAAINHHSLPARHSFIPLTLPTVDGTDRRRCARRTAFKDSTEFFLTVVVGLNVGSKSHESVPQLMPSLRPLNFDSTAFDGRSTDQSSLRSQWRNPASRSHADLFIYFGRSATARTQVGLRSWRRSLNAVEWASNGGRIAVES